MHIYDARPPSRNSAYLTIGNSREGNRTEHDQRGRWLAIGDVAAAIVERLRPEAAS
jgi:hypothetical protein